MNKFSNKIGKQFAVPHGFVGRICCKIMNVINRALYNKVINEIDANENSKILDVGFGNGFLINKLHKKFGAWLSGIEPSASMCKVASKKNKKAIAAGKVCLDLADCCNLPYENGSFDFVASINTIYFWQDALKGLMEIYRVLNDDGIFYNAVYSKQWLQKLPYTKSGFNFFEIDDFISLGKKAGFFKVEVIKIKKNKSFVVKFQKNERK